MLESIHRALNPAAGIAPDPPWPLKNGLYMPQTGNVRSPLILAVLCVATMGLYYFWWIYITARHAREHARIRNYPVWRTLTQLIPIYRIFRLRAHLAEYKRLADNSGAPCNISLRAATLAALYVDLAVPVTTVMAWVGWNLLPAILNIAILPVALITMIWLQANMNAYWTHYVGGRAAERAPFTLGEASYCLISTALALLTTALI